MTRIAMPMEQGAGRRIRWPIKHLIFFNLIFTVIPLSSAPNHRSGVILGQHGFLNTIVSSAVPRSILVHRGEEVKENIWGDISLYEYLDPVGDLTSFHPV